MTDGEADRQADADAVVDQVITCIDCGGRAHLITYPPEDGRWLPGDLITYRCADCLDRWDLVVPGEDDGEGA